MASSEATGYCRSMIFSENRYPLFGIMLCRSMIFPENRYPPRIKSGAGFFGIILYGIPAIARASPVNSRMCMPVLARSTT
jgi:hypothetical protein